MLNIGIMQGRLSPADGDYIQPFPVNTWKEEFNLAFEAKLNYIEWVYEKETKKLNPIRNDLGIREIQEFSSKSGVTVSSLCADYFMQNKLISEDGNIIDDPVQHLIWLIGRVETLNARYIVLPFVEQSSLNTPKQVSCLIELMKSIIPIAIDAKVEIHLETDLEPLKLIELYHAIDHPNIRANYDIGNSASLGYNPEEELSLLKPWLGSVHVKDRFLGGKTVQLGTGDADFSTCFRILAESNFKGPYILQTARNADMSELKLAIHNKNFVKDYLKNYS